MSGYITKEEFRALLDLFMFNDPWPLEDSANSIIERFLDRTAQAYNFPTWVDAYHAKEIQ